MYVLNILHPKCKGYILNKIFGWNNFTNCYFNSRSNLTLLDLFSFSEIRPIIASSLLGPSAGNLVASNSNSSKAVE